MIRPVRREPGAMKALQSGILILLLASSSPAEEDDWTQFLGPRGNGTSPERHLRRAWPAGGPPLLWKAKIQMGWSSPSFSRGRVSVAASGNTNGMTETVACLA